MMNEAGLRRTLPDQSSGSGRTFDTSRHQSIISAVQSKRVCFYKSGDPQFNGLRMVINNRTFKTFDALLDSLSKKVPLPFGVRNITTPRGVHSIGALDEFEDGKSYLCSDSRKVKPFNLALAQRKLPPWYHARPASSRRRTVQQARFFPGRKTIHRQEPVVVHTPKRLVVYRNGDPSVRHTVVLQRKTTASYESILNYISELMKFHVNKLHTPDGRRVDGLPGLILCSGTVVAVGREPFRPATYRAQQPPAPIRQHSNRKGFRGQKTLNSKKKSPSRSSKSKRFSPSSEKYIVHQIFNSVAESSCDLPSNLCNSAELDSNGMLESAAGTEGDAWRGDGAEGQDRSLPNDDNIEKSFRVNQDGSMTVEMKVRLTVKEEETVQWTTTLTRSAAADPLIVACLPESEAERQIGSNKSQDSQSSATSTDAIHKDRPTVEDDDELPSLGSGASSVSCHEDGDTDVASPRRSPTPGCKKTSRHQASVESIKTVTMDGIGEGTVGSYTYREQTENRTKIEQSCTVNQSSTRPVPKPRRLGSVDVKCGDISALKSSQMTEILRESESSGEEVTETVLHIYEQQTCQANFLANACAQGGVAFGPAASESGPLFSNNEFEMELWGPSTASKPVSIWRGNVTSVTSDFHPSSLKTDAVQGQESKKGQVKPQQKEVTRVFSKSKLTSKHVRLVVTPRKRQKKSFKKGSEKRKRVKPFSSAVFIRRIYGNKSSSGKKLKRPKKKPTQNWDKGMTTKILTEPGNTMKTIAKDSRISMSLEHRMSKESTDFQPRGILTRQTSAQVEEKRENKSSDVSKNISLPPLNSSSSVTKEYVENWLEKAHLNPASNPHKELRISEVFTLAQKENGRCGERKEEEKLEPPRENLIAPSVKLRVESFEKKASVEKTAASHTSTTKSDYNTSNQQNTPVKPLSNGICSEIIPASTETSTEIALDGEDGNSATPTDIFSMELPPPPPELLDDEYFTQDVPSTDSSPLYRLSSMSSQLSDNYPFIMSPTSEQVTSAPHKTVEKPSAQMDYPSIPKEAEISRTPSIKRAPLISNGSLERKMSLRKASLDKYTSGHDATPTVGDKELPHGAQRVPLEAGPPEGPRNSVLDLGSPSVCTSGSPASSTSDERPSTGSILSSDASVPIPPKQTPSPKTQIKKVKLKSSPSPERKFQNKKSSAELQNSSPKLPPATRRSLDNAVIPKIGIQKHSPPNASPSTERKHHTPKEVQRASPYSLSLDVVSPPVRRRAGKFLSRNVSLDKSSEPTSKTQKKTSAQEQSQQTPSGKSDELEAGGSKAGAAGQEDSVTDTPVKPQRLNTVNQPNMKPVLEKICYSIKSIKQMTQSKRPSCLEKSNSLPDFSSHVASTFGSSSKALLAFLAVMTLKEGLTNLNSNELNANNVSCAEALKMIDSLREIANIEDSQKLKSSLSNLQQSASKQLLQSWKGFQELGDRSRSRSSTPNASEVGLVAEAGSEQDCGFEENLIDEIIENLDIPGKLKEELVSLSDGSKSESSNKEKPSAGITERSETSANRDNQENTDYFPSKEAEVDVNVKSSMKIIKQSEMDCSDPVLDTEKYKPDQVFEDSDGSERPNCKTEVTHQEHQRHQIQQQGDTDERSTPERTNRSGDIRSETTFKTESRTVKPEEQYMEFRQLMMQTEENLPENEVTHSDKEEETISRAGGDLDLVSKTCEQRSLEDATEVTCEARKQENSESQSENKELSSNNYVEVNLEEKKTRSNTSGEQLSEEAQPEVTFKISESPVYSMGLNISTDDSAGGSDAEEPSSEEEQPVVDCKKLQVIIEEGSSGNEEEQDEESSHDRPNFRKQDRQCSGGLEALREETEEDQVSSGDEDPESPVSLDRDVSTLFGNQDLYKKKDTSSLIISETLGKDCGFNTDDDSGNNHSSCEEHGDELQDGDGQISSSVDEELSYYEKHSSSEEEQASMDRNMDVRHLRRPEAPVKTQPERMNGERVVDDLKQQSEEIVTQSVAERVILLEKQVAEAQKVRNAPKTSTVRCSSQRKAPAESEESPSGSPTPELALCTRSAPQSSLSFSYDSSGVITTEPEGSRVRSIREMFLAKSATDIQQRHFPSPNSSDLPEVRAETSASAGYQSQNSGELSSEDESSRKSIAKGFVRRTIEMLYGKKDAKTEEERERPPSEPNQRKKEPSGIFSPFHAVRSKAMSELSYFNSTGALDAFSEATRCIAFNAQVAPRDGVPSDNGHWLLRETTQMRKSVSDPVGINKTFTNDPHDEGLCKDTESNSPYSLFSTKAEPEDETKTLPRKCTYFSLPHASESEVCQDDLNTVSKSSFSEDQLVEEKDTSEDTETWAERNGILPSLSVPDFKMKDNKVHPLVELPADGEVVVRQPGKGQGVVNRRVPEPDVLDLLYHFCGEHCPIL